MARRHPLVTVAAAGVGLGVLAFLFAATLRQVGSRPYTVPAAALAGWSVALDPRPASAGPLLVLHPPPELAMSLFDQVFQRTMESYAAPARAAMTLVTRHEYDRSLAGVIEPRALLALAEGAGLGAGRVVPQCMVVHRERGAREQRLFFVRFDLPAFGRFRRAVAERTGPAGGFDPSALDSAVLVAVSDSRLLGRDASPAMACEAPVGVAPSE